MDIKNIQSITRIYGEQSKASKNSKIQSASLTQQQDEVILSSKAQEMSPYLRSIKAMPEVRDGRVSELSEQIENGEYKVDSQELADRIIAYSKNERFF